MSAFILAAGSSEGDPHLVFIEKRADGSAWLEITVTDQTLGIDLDPPAVAALSQALSAGGAT